MQKLKQGLGYQSSSSLAKGFFAILIMISLTFFQHTTTVNNMNRLKPISLPKSHSKMLIVAPHNDDEIISSGGIIQYALLHKIDVSVLFITNGEAQTNAIRINALKLNPSSRDYIQLGKTKQQESIEALHILGVSKSQISFLGFPDGCLNQLWENRVSHQPLKSSYTRVDTVPYADVYNTSAQYTAENLTDEICCILNDFKPDYIIYPHMSDLHKDHAATHLFVKLALGKSKVLPKEASAAVSA